MSTSWHGLLAAPSWETPVCTLASDNSNRPGYEGAQNASEFVDTPTTLELKVKVMADLIRSASNFVVYSGAGISTGSGINDYATDQAKLRSALGDAIKSKGSAPRSSIHAGAGLSHPYNAKPTPGHFVLTSLYHAGYLKQWINQNHDGLPQKAGFPQVAMNEIHGAWFDPSNPVVAMSGSLRTDLFSRLLEAEESTDLCLSIGTSMVGMNADRVFTTVAKKAAAGDSGVFGGIIINKQKTQYDSISSLRIFGDISHVLKLLAAELDLEPVIQCPTVAYPVDSLRPCADGDGSVVKLPFYSSTGERLPHGSPPSATTLDLREGASVKLVDGPFKGDTGEITSSAPVFYRIRFFHKLKMNNDKKQPCERLLGKFMVEALIRGDLECMPLVNV